MFVYTGDYVEHKNDTPLHSTYYTFTPRLLMGGGFYTMTDEMASLLATAHRSIGVLEGMLLSFHDRETLAGLTLLKEICYSRMIDYPDFDFNSVLLNRGLGKADDAISNFALAYHRASEEKKEKTSIDDIARCALYGNQSKIKNCTRSSQIFLSKSVSNYRQYNPTAPKDIHVALNDIERYAELDEIDVLIKAAMCHYQFEMIHPYERYNGIIGRLLVYKMLHNTGLSGARYLSLSECLCNHKDEYFKKLGQTQKSGNYGAWVEFFIRIVCEAAQNGIASAQDYINIIRSDDENLTSIKSSSYYLTDVYNYFKKTVVSSVKQTSNQLQITYGVASRAIDTLQHLGILTQSTEQSRNRLFSHAGLLRLFYSEQV